MNHPNLIADQTTITRFVERNCPSDAIQEAALCTLTRLGRADLEPVKDVEKYLSTCKRHAELTERRLVSRHQELPDASQQDPASTSSLDEIEHGETRKIVLDALERLSEREQRTFYCLHFAGLSIAEIAVTLECTENAVHVALSKAKRKLAKELGLLLNPRGAPTSKNSTART